MYIFKRPNLRMISLWSLVAFLGIVGLLAADVSIQGMAYGLLASLGLWQLPKATARYRRQLAAFHFSYPETRHFMEARTRITDYIESMTEHEQPYRGRNHLGQEIVLMQFQVSRKKRSFLVLIRDHGNDDVNVVYTFSAYSPLVDRTVIVPRKNFDESPPHWDMPKDIPPGAFHASTEDLRALEMMIRPAQEFVR